MRQSLPTAVIVLAAAVLAVHGPILQPADYHRFADARTLLGVPNALDVLSNLGFGLVGLWGLVRLHDATMRERLARAWTAYAWFFTAMALTMLGSGFYHLAPDDWRLVWDRLPIAIACAALLAAVRSETHADQPGWVLPFLIVAAVLGVRWWVISGKPGEGDLRPYLLMQAAPLVLIPLWQWIAGSPWRDRLAFGAAVALYVAAKIFELADHPVFAALGVSGHTIKHLLAALAAAVIAANVFRRRARPATSR